MSVSAEYNFEVSSRGGFGVCCCDGRFRFVGIVGFRVCRLGRHLYGNINGLVVVDFVTYIMYYV